jgi:hypothetical protein
MHTEKGHMALKGSCASTHTFGIEGVKVLPSGALYLGAIHLATDYLVNLQRTRPSHFPI